MTDYQTTWWFKIGKMSEFDKDGISSPIYQSVETGEQVLSRKLPIGALYCADRSKAAGPNEWPPVGRDGLSIVCVLLGDGDENSRHHWHIDSRAANCTLPMDKEHRCWVRHGTYKESIHVDKNGKTCGAGAGSIFMDNKKWHGFLHNGVLKQS